MDNEIGRVLDAAKENASDALIIYTSDHGEMMYAHGLNKKGPAMYEEITNIPFIVLSPGVTPLNGSSDALISQVDITPTILDYFNAEIPPVISGKSLMPVIKDPDLENRDVLFMEFGRFEIDHDGYTGFQPIRSAFDGRYKLVINLLDQDELYDLDNDPGEINNLINNKDALPTGIICTTALLIG